MITIAAKHTADARHREMVIEKLHARSYAFISLLYDTQYYTSMQAITEKFVGRYKHIVLVGIGGSLLGAKTIVDALYKERVPELHFWNSIDPITIQKAIETIEVSTTLFLIQSKSGNTLECIALTSTIELLLNESGLQPHNHILIVTENKDSYLQTMIAQKHYTHLRHPSEIGGRFSVLSASGMTLAHLVNLDTKSLIQGALDVVDATTHSLTKTAIDLADSIFMHGAQFPILVSFLYSHSLETFNQWWMQLVSESLSKDGYGITPLPALGTQDHHSLLQMFVDGNNSYQFVFTRIRDHLSSLRLGAVESDQYRYLSRLPYQMILDASYQGVIDSLKDKQKPVSEILLDHIDAYHLGGLFMTWEIVVASLGEWMKIDAFNQPGVEESKQRTENILRSLAK